MSTDFCPGYAREPFATLCRDYPDSSVYPAADFRVEWGPIFHRGRLDGSARLLVIGQDPAANENFIRRILVGAAGQRAQGFLQRLGYTRSYVLLNTYLYSVYGQGGANQHIGDHAIAAYREQWIDAILADGNIEAVVALGGLADKAWHQWKASHAGDPHRQLPYQHITHPTQPESAGGNSAAKVATLTKALLVNWSAALTALHPHVQHPDVVVPLKTYGATWQPGDLGSIPPADMPPGIPAWMRDQDRWAQRVGTTAALKRANLTVTVPTVALASVARSEAADEIAPAVAVRAVPASATPGNTLALRGTVVTMDASSRVLADHVVWIEGGVIRDIRPATAPAPEGLESVHPVATGGYIYPGLFDLHSHLAYNVLPLWPVPKRYTNRSQWSGIAEYRRNVCTPMSTVARLPGMLPAICRYVECKAIMGGATTSQGIKLVNEAGIATYFRGLLRNVELTDDPGLPSASARIGDVDARDAARFLTALKREKTCYLLHLSEGTDAAAREHFLALRESGGQWAITSVLGGIHSVALQPADFEVLARFGASVVWSPTSNLLLYGQTTDIAAARAAGVKIGIGADWSPTGSKNILGELKTARLYSHAHGNLLSDEQIVAMATREAAEILRWDRAGSLEPGKVADLLVTRRHGADPYQSLIECAETDLRLVMIGGVARYGDRLMKTLAADLEHIEVGGEARSLNLAPNAGGAGHHATVEPLALADARQRLTDAFAHLQQTAPAAVHLSAITRDLNGGWRLGLDEIENDGVEMRPLMGLKGAARRSGPTRPQAAEVAVPATVRLDPLTVADDPAYLKTMAAEKNLPPWLAKGLKPLYG